MTIEEKIGILWELPDEERIEIEQYVEAHGHERPDLKEALEESRRWEEFLRDARALNQDPPGQDALAFYAVTRGLDVDRAPESIREVLERLESRIAASPELSRRLAELDRRGEELEHASDAEAQFARLAAETDTLMRPPARRKGRVLRRVAAGLTVAATVYGLLFVAGLLMQPETARLARFDASDLQVEGYDAVRGDVPDGSQTHGPPVTFYLRALDQLRQAQTGVLGLFPGFDQTRLDSAATYLHEVLRLEPPESFLSSEALYLLGKTELARGNVDAAREAFTRVDGRRRPEATALLRRLDAMRASTLQPPTDLQRPSDR